MVLSELESRPTGSVHKPKISIVTATYNSSHLLRYAIKSVLASEFEDWEMLVIGDCCTDDTEACVNSFNDPRIKFSNLAVNSGQQATPNNVGVESASGTYLCFLNQDDMFLPWHLTYMLEQMRAKSVDILCAHAAIIEPFDVSTDSIDLVARSSKQYAGQSLYSPQGSYRASTWIMPTVVAREIGPWKLEAEIFMNPSQDWLFRASRKGKRILCSERVSVVLLNSGDRVNSYKKRQDAEHGYIFDQVVIGDSRRTDMLESVDRGKYNLRRHPLRQCLKICYYATAGRILSTLGIHPKIPIFIVRFGVKRGGMVRNWKRNTGANLN